MEAPVCGCCEERPALGWLRARPLAGGAAEWEEPLCAPCTKWLMELVTRVEDGARTGVFGAPDGNARALVFDDQCDLCRRVGAATSTIDLERGSGRARPFPPLRLCAPCGTWLHGLAADGRSARRERSRFIDGSYGEWPHPNLRGITFAIDSGDVPGRDIVARVCIRMGLMPSAADAAIHFVEAGAGYAARRTRELIAARGERSVVVLAPPGVHGDLVAALEAGASDWLTVPSTPQQVTGAIVRAQRFLLAAWDRETALRRLAPGAELPPAVAIDPLPGTAPAEAAWLLRRFARGYDDLAVIDGRIVLLPRTPRDQLEAVARRLATVLAGHCLATVLSGAPPGRRFQATG